MDNEGRGGGSDNSWNKGYGEGTAEEPNGNDEDNKEFPIGVWKSGNDDKEFPIEVWKSGNDDKEFPIGVWKSDDNDKEFPIEVWKPQDNEDESKSANKCWRFQNKGNQSHSNSEDNKSRKGFNNPIRRNPRKKESCSRTFGGSVFDYRKLCKLSIMNPDEVVLCINKDKEEWMKFLESVDDFEDSDSDKIILIIQVIGEKICGDIPVLKQQQINVITDVCGSTKFLQKVVQVVSTPRVIMSTSRHTISEFLVDTSPMKVMGNVYQMCDFVVKTMPHLALDNLSSLIDVSVRTLCGSLDSSAAEMMANFKTLREQIQEFDRKQKEKEGKKKGQKFYGFNEADLAEFDQDTPPDNFREIEVIPMSGEVLSTQEVFLRPNKTSGAYVDSNHYLDVQFRLLREDFVRPFRQGIQTFLKNSSEYIDGTRKLPLGEVRLYTEVRMNQVVKERDSIVYKLQLPEHYYKNIFWEKSKRLLAGSLVVLTTTDKPFETAHFGVIYDRHVKELQMGIFTVIWEGSPPGFLDGVDYLMFESEVYLEAYRHTLEALKAIELDSYPMKKFIVDARSTVGAPKYLQSSKAKLNFSLGSWDERCIEPLKDEQWPSAEEFGLDDNQFAAFKAAITKEFTIIQGPPGTGKTFIGLKVAEVLLRNSELWNESMICGEYVTNPITVVCYTNHALDQFLEGILKYYEKEWRAPEIIRIGGQCKSELLQEYTLKEVRSRNKHKLPKWYKNMTHDAWEDVNALENLRFEKMNEVLGLLNLEGIVDFEKLSRWYHIRNLYPSSLWSCFRDLAWFGLDKTNLERKKMTDEEIEAFISGIFQIREYPKNLRKTNSLHQQQPTTKPPVSQATEETNQDDDDYDLDELLEHRLVDDILLESETSTKVCSGEFLKYVPYGSYRTCKTRYDNLWNLCNEIGKDPSQVQAQLAYHQEEMTALENRSNLLYEILSLYKEQLIDLPDVSDLMEYTGDIRTNFYGLEMAKRWALYFEVVHRTRIFMASVVANAEEMLVRAQKARRNLMEWGDGLILKGCKVVGLTTTGAAKYSGLLKMIGSKIVIVEEAAEVFEAHIVTSITQKCEQLILIGDHRQLRPSPTVYELAIKYNLDLSLFERMINNNLHCYSLKMQHRMRPEISDLVVGSIYTELLNHDSVKLYPNVKGVTKNVYFLTHTQEESAESDSCSKSNQHEAKFISAFCRYLILQDYKPEQITVLTMYTGQILLLKREISETCEGVRITCVDNFQGEENDIILLSLVRSNSEGKIGFLNIDNRICVSLSRAKQGLYVIGNMSAMGSKSKTWKIIMEKLEAQEEVGTELELVCQIHGVRTKVKSAQDFNNVPDGGCDKPCDTDLPCSHKCRKACHFVDQEHKAYKCQLPCLKVCDNPEYLHPCKGKCFEKCPPCDIKVEKILNCELKHKEMIPCFKSVDEVSCSKLVEKILPCGHKEVLACHINIHMYECKVKLRKQLRCGHSKKMACHEDPELIRCKQQIDKILPCNHSQTYECWLSPDRVKCELIVSKTLPKCGHKVDVECGNLDKEVFCRSKCTTRLACGHDCVELCHVDDDPDHIGYVCLEECTRKCKFGHECQWSHPCYKPCPPCTKEILRLIPKCYHQKFLECHVDHSKYECHEQCPLIHPNCGHQCQNLCFEPCGPCKMTIIKETPCGHFQNISCNPAEQKEDCMELVPPLHLQSCGH